MDNLRTGFLVLAIALFLSWGFGFYEQGNAPKIEVIVDCFDEKLNVINEVTCTEEIVDKDSLSFAGKFFIWFAFLGLIPVALFGFSTDDDGGFW